MRKTVKEVFLFKVILAKFEMKSRPDFIILTKTKEFVMQASSWLS
jgi:hypothetical protein